MSRFLLRWGLAAAALNAAPYVLVALLRLIGAAAVALRLGVLEHSRLPAASIAGVLDVLLSNSVVSPAAATFGAQDLITVLERSPEITIAVIATLAALAWSRSRLWEDAAELVHPSLPPFLYRPRPADGDAWNPRTPLRGRQRELAALDAFGRSDGGVSFYGLSGAAGVGKTRIAAEWLRGLGPTWDWGVLRREPDKGWRARRNTAILVESTGDPQRIRELVSAFDDNSKKIRILFEARSDPDLEMVDGGESGRRLRERRWRFDPIGPPRSIKRRFTERLPRAAKRSRERHYIDAQAIAIDPEEARYGPYFFLKVHPLASGDLARDEIIRDTAANMGVRLAPDAVAAIAQQSDGLPARCRALVEQFAGGDASQQSLALSRREAAEFLRQAVAHFGTDGLKLLVLGTFTGGEPAALRARLAPSAGDQHKLAELFDDWWDGDIENLIPSIEGGQRGAEIALQALCRLQKPDRELLLSGMIEAAPRRFREFLADHLGYLREAPGAIVQSVVADLMDLDPPGERELGLDFRHGHFRSRADVLANCMRLDAAWPPAPEEQPKMIAELRKRRAFAGLLAARTAHRVADRGRLVRNLAQLLYDEDLREEVYFLSLDPDWVRHPNALGHVLGVYFDWALNNPQGYAPPDALEWLDRVAPASNLPELDENDPCAAGMRAFRLMDEYFYLGGGPAPEHLLARAPADDAFLASCLRSGGLMERFAAVWALTWMTAAPLVGPPPRRPEPELLEALGRIAADPRAPEVLWAKAAATIAKLAVPAVPADILYSWAVWADTGKDRPAPLAAGALLDRAAYQDALDLAKKRLSQARSAGARRVAAFLIGAFEPGHRQASSVLAEAAINPRLNLDRRETAMAKLVQMGSPAARDALFEAYQARGSESDLLLLPLAALDEAERLRRALRRRPPEEAQPELDTLDRIFPR